MKNWSSVEEILTDYDVLIKLLFCLFGLYVWEILDTIDFEWSFVTRRRKLRWPLGFFFLARYCMLFAFIGLLITVSAREKINCYSSYLFSSWSLSMATLCATTSLMIRTIALWKRKLAVTIPLLLLCVGHWVISYRAMLTVEGIWLGSYKTCAIIKTNPRLLKISFFYTMLFDLAILGFTSAALLRKNNHRSGLWQLLFGDGLVFFLVSFSVNTVPAVLNIFNLNPVMNFIAIIPAACFSTIAACRCTIRLQEFGQKDVYIYSSGRIAPMVVDSTAFANRQSRSVTARPEVYINTERIVTDGLWTVTAGALDSPGAKRSIDVDSEKDIVEVDIMEKGIAV